MSRGVTYIRRFGRIIPIHASRGFTPAPVVQQASAGIRKSMQAGIAAKTSLSEKRIKAVRFVRESLSSLKSMLLNERFGDALFNITKKHPTGVEYAVVQKPKWVAKIPWEAIHRNAGGWGGNILTKNRRAANRMAFDTLLNKKGLAPESFRVQTSQHNYFVSQRVDTFPSPIEDIGSKAYKWEQKKFSKLVDRIRRFQVEPTDLSKSNIGFTNAKKKKFLAIDTGHFRVTGDENEVPTGIVKSKFNSLRLQKTMSKKTIRARFRE